MSRGQAELPRLGPSRRVLVTGFPIASARRLVRELVASGDRVLMLARPRFEAEARAFQGLLQRDAERAGVGGAVELLWGDILELDLGLSGEEIRRLHAEVEVVHHLAAVQYLGVDSAKMRRVNVEGLREVLEVALGMRQLRRFCHWSSVFVAGDRAGVVLEDELDVGQRFRNSYEASKAEAERLARAAMARLPLTVLRPPILVGDSETGEVLRFDGPYLLITAIVNAPPGVAVPLPADGRYPFPILPVDYVARAGIALERHPDAVGGTFHLVDRAPLSAYDFACAVADAAGRPRPTRLLPDGLSRAVLGLPGIRRWAKQQRSFVEWFDTDVRFDDRRAQALLAPLGLAPPALRSYVDVLVRYVREHGP
jgi:thioester reductase-like protein